MSIDLDWSQLDRELCGRALDGINNLLQTTSKPGFLGDIVATDFSFGSSAPDFELVEIRDVYEEFLHIDEDILEDDDEAPPSSNNARDKRATSPTNSLGGFSGQLGHRPLGTPGLFSPTVGGPLWMPRQSITSASSAAGYPFPRLGAAAGGHDMDRRSNASSSAYTRGRIPGRNISPSVAPPADPSSSISCQLHFRVAYSGNMTISMRTSIRVNYPSLSFMSLPLSIRLSGLAFQGVVAVAYEGDRKRLHVTILDGNEKGTASGHNLLRKVVVESEVGQTDKLVLKDMANIEQFVLDVARKALEVSLPLLYLTNKSVQCFTLVQDEIAWPNFQSFAWT